MSVSRYKNSKIIKDKNGITKYNTTKYSDIPERSDDIYLLSTEGDRFDLLALKYYGDPSLWWFLAKANKLVFNNVPRGTTIRIPARSNSD